MSIEAIARNSIAAGFGEYEWSALLGDIAEWVGGEKSLLLGSRSKSALFPNIVHNYDPAIIARYGEGYNLLDPRRPHSLATPVGECGLGQAYVPNDQIRKTAYFADISEYGDVKDSVHGVISDDPQYGRFSISIHRGFKREYFEQAQALRLKAVLPLLDRAMQTSRRLLFSQQAPGGAKDQARVLIDADLQLLPLDDLARLQDMLAPLDQVHVSPGKLLIDQFRLRTVFAAAVEQTLQGHHSSFILQNFRFSFAPMPQGLGWMTGENEWVYVTLSKVEAELGDASRMFAATFEMTPKETELLGHLANGLDLKESAKALSIGYETARWHVKNMCVKSGYAQSRRMVMDAAAGNVSRVLRQ